MPMPTLVNLSSLIDDAKCYDLVRQHRWPEGARCPLCEGAEVARGGRDDVQPHRQRYRCKGCGSRFDGLTGAVLAGLHQPWSLLRSWLRPRRGVSQEKLPLYLGFFQLVHNTRRRGKALLGPLVATLVT